MASPSKHLLKFSAVFLLTISSWLSFGSLSAAAASLPYGSPNPQNGAVGVVATIPSSPPTSAPTIAVPSSNQSLSSQPSVVSGLCQTNMLVKIFSNGDFIGSAICTNGSFSITAALFDGQNQLTAIDYDALNQAGPQSSTVTVSYTNPLGPATPQILLTSDYATRGAAPGSQLSWPILISGGTAPYAVTIDWGDGTIPDLISQRTAGTILARHTYQQAGVYKVLVKATDQNGIQSYLQLVGVGNGAILQVGGTSHQKGSQAGRTSVVSPVTWWPAALSIPCIFATFWLGRKYELSSIRRRIDESTRQL